MKLKGIVQAARKLEREWRMKQQARLDEIPDSFIMFCEKCLGLKIAKYHAEAAELLLKHNDVALCWARQTGKTHLISAFLLWYALKNPNSQIAVVGPSWRQSIITITKINYFRTRLPPSLFHKPQKTIVHLKNGSLIQAFPNNPNNLRGYTLHCVYADELNFIPNDEEMWDAISFTLATTNGKFVCSSTPGSTDSLFWRIWHDDAFKHFAKLHVTYERALNEGGPLTREWVEKKRREYEGDPWRWRREMLAEWAEDESVWLPLSLITSCIDHALEYSCFEDLENGDFYAGLDLGKHQDYSVLSIVKTEDSSIRLTHQHQFPHKTPYASVIGYAKTICDRWQTIHRILVDMSGVGDYVVEDMQNAGINAEVEGVKFTQDAKEKIASYLKQCMVEKRLRIPYDPELIAELNLERFELGKDGRLRFSHPEGTNDDRFWSLALAAYATREAAAAGRLWVIPRIARAGKSRLEELRRKLWRRKYLGVGR